MVPLRITRSTSLISEPSVMCAHASCRRAFVPVSLWSGQTSGSTFAAIHRPTDACHRPEGPTPRHREASDPFGTSDREVVEFLGVAAQNLADALFPKIAKSFRHAVHRIEAGRLRIIGFEPHVNDAEIGDHSGKTTAFEPEADRKSTRLTASHKRAH